MPKPALPEATKACAGCGETISRAALQLDWDKWLRRRFCTDQCRRDRDRREGRTNGDYIGKVRHEKRLSRDEHFAFWRERFTAKEIHDMASAIDFLTGEGRQAA